MDSSSSMPRDASVKDTRDLLHRDHLHRLRDVFPNNPLYFITCCVAGRRPLLVTSTAVAALEDALKSAPRYHQWHVGRYVIMPDHVHFFARGEPEAKPLTDFMRDWKKWTARAIVGAHRPLWQPEFFDHVLRSAQSYSEKWEYVRQNPVRARLVATPEEWPYAGEGEVLSY